MHKNPIVKNILSAVAVAIFGFILLNLTFIFDFLFQSLVDSVIKLFTPADINMNWSWFPTVLTGPFLSILVAVIHPIDKSSSENAGVATGFNLGPVSLILSVFTLVMCIRAFKKGERSWVLWVGFVPAILSGAFWIFMIIGEFIFPH